MTRLERIEAEVAALPDNELRHFRSWFEDFAAKRWDREVLSDSGKLDTLAAEALAEYVSGKCKPL